MRNFPFLVSFLYDKDSLHWKWAEHNSWNTNISVCGRKMEKKFPNIIISIMCSVFLQILFLMLIIFKLLQQGLLPLVREYFFLKDHDFW